MTSSQENAHVDCLWFSQVLCIPIVLKGCHLLQALLLSFACFAGEEINDKGVQHRNEATGAEAVS